MEVSAVHDGGVFIKEKISAACFAGMNCYFSTGYKQ